jgi:hypothetical protein
LTELDYRTPPVAGFADRSTMLLVVGIFFIIAGVLCGCGVLTMPLALFAPRPANGPPPPRIINIVMGALMYAILCAALLSLGIGAIRKRRWVRPLVIVFGWIGLIAGVVGMIIWGFALPEMANAMRAATPPGSPAPPAAMLRVMVGFITIFLAFIYIIIPATLLWLFRSPDVQATLDHYDPRPRWTDGMPLPVLALVVLLALGAFWGVMATMQGWFAAFGFITSGAPARVISILLAAVFAVAAWLTFHRRPAGWWLAMVLFLLGPLAWITTLLTRDLLDIYRAMGMTEAELRPMASMRVMNSPMAAVGMAVVALITIGFTWHSRKYFQLPDLQPTETSSPQSR